MVLGIPASAPTKEEAQALAIFNGLADGHIDRKLFTNYCNAYFNQQTIEDFAASLKPLGPPLSFKADQRGSPRRHDFPRLRRHLSRTRAEGDHLRDARRKAGTISRDVYLLKLRKRNWLPAEVWRRACAAIRPADCWHLEVCGSICLIRAKSSHQWLELRML